MRKPRHIDCVICPDTQIIYTRAGISLFFVSFYILIELIFSEDQSIMVIHLTCLLFNCLIEFYCTISRFSHPFDSHPFLSISLLSSFVPLTVTNSGQ